MQHLKAEGKQIVNKMKNEVVAAYNYHTGKSAIQQFTDFGSFIAEPERAEDVLLFFGPSNLLLNEKSNLLKLETSATTKAAKYMSGTFKIGPKTLERVTKHLENIGMESEAGNKIMLARMEKIAKGQMQATEVDLNFARHELRESEFMKNRMELRDAHHATLKEQNMYHPESEGKLFTQEALDASNVEWEKDTKNK